MIFHCISAKVQVVKKKSTAGGEGGGAGVLVIQGL